MPTLVCVVRTQRLFYTHIHKHINKISVEKKIIILSHILAVYVTSGMRQCRIGKNMGQIYDESALTYDTYNELRGLNSNKYFFGNICLKDR